MHRVLGLDLSLTSTGLVLLPEGWASGAARDWSGVSWMSVGQKLETTAPEWERIARLHELSEDIVAFAAEHKPTHVAVEDYAYTSQVSQARAVAELTGLVKWRLHCVLGLPLVVVAPATARKTFLGKNPARDGKAIAGAACGRLPVPWKPWSMADGYLDICDAFVVANHHMQTLGLPCVTLEAP